MLPLLRLGGDGVLGGKAPGSSLPVERETSPGGTTPGLGVATVAAGVGTAVKSGSAGDLLARAVKSEARITPIKSAAARDKPATKGSTRHVLPVTVFAGRGLRGATTVGASDTGSGSVRVGGPESSVFLVGMAITEFPN